jgi:tRNA threonylcarbamoyl adenosine modification protein (Sua5/YciO/YrdC/YwlC family)
MLLKIHPDNPQPRQMKTVADTLSNGGVIIYPTDTIYGLGCDIYNTKAIEKICRIKHISDPKKAQFSFICADLTNLSEYITTISKPVFRYLKSLVPGPFTFILEANKQVPKLLKSKKDTVGIRVPDHNISREIVQLLGHPIMSTSLPMEGNHEYYTDPETIFEIFGKEVDIVIDSGAGNVLPSTVIDLTSGSPELVRQGAGEWPALSV